MKTICIISIVILLFNGCTSSSNKSAKNNNTNQIKNSSIASKIQYNSKVCNYYEEVLPDSIILRHSIITNNNYSLKVETYYLNDNVELSDDVINNIVLKQEVEFLFKDSVLKEMNFPVKKLKVNTEKGNSIKIQENNIYEISIVNGKKSWLYEISGGGVSGSQSEFYGLYSSLGKLLCYSYSSYQNYKKVQSGLPDEGFGDIDKVLNEYGISEQEFNKPEHTVYIGSFSKPQQ